LTNEACGPAKLYAKWEYEERVSLIRKYWRQSGVADEAIVSAETLW